MVPTEVTRAVLADETAAITAWADRRQWTVAIDPASLVLTAQADHPAGGQVRFHADLTGYPALPPAWECRNATGSTEKSAYPQPGNRPGLTGSIFHPNPVICAPWNRLAYAEHAGPHPDWGGPTNWKTAAAGSTQAHTLTDMLATLDLHLSASPGFQA